MFEQIKLVISILPIIIEAVKQIEALFPESGNGRQKLELVKNILISADSNLEDSWPLISKVIGSVVAFCNSTGLFKKNN